MELREWQYMNPPQVAGTSGQVTSGSSSGYKKRFLKLLTYHVTHRNKMVVSYKVKTLTDDSFLYIEEFKNPATGEEWEVEYSVYIGGLTEAWRLIVRKNGRYPDDLRGTGWVNLLRELRPYMSIPTTGTPEYKELLTESFSSELKEWKYINPPKPASSKTNKEKFTELIDYMMKRKSSLVTKTEAVRIDDGGFTYKEYYKSSISQDYTLTLLVGHSRFNSSWKYELYMDTNLIKEVQGSGWEELLEELEKYFHVPKAGSPEYKKLCESTSIADDFKLYENLWDDDEGKRFKVIMVVDDEEYTYGTYDSRNRANEVAMKVRDERGVETYIEEV